MVKNFKNHFPEGSGVKLLHNGIIVVEADHVDREIAIIEQKILQNRVQNPNDKYLLLHLGVAGSLESYQLRLETRCFNARNFRGQNSYDENYRVGIEDGQDLGAIYTTPIDLSAIVNKPKR